jgi:PPOX class probable F420-dependent enzyme
VAQLTESQARMFTEPFYGVVSNVRKDGSPHQSVVWVDYDGANVLVNTAEGRAKPRHIRANPHVGVAVVDPENPYRWISVSGPAEMTEDGAEEHIHKLSWKYRGREYDLPEGQQRLLVRVRPEKITAYGLD